MVVVVSSALLPIPIPAVVIHLTVAVDDDGDDDGDDNGGDDDDDDD